MAYYEMFRESEKELQYFKCVQNLRQGNSIDKL